MTPSIGITEENRLSVSRELSKLLADEHVLYMKTRNAHWNVEGPDFHAMHLFFEGQYGQVAELADSLAERIRALGNFAPGTLKLMLELTHLSEMSREGNDSLSYIRELLADHETIIINLRENINRFANDFKDLSTSDFITGIMETHEKMAWCLRAHLR